mgnify:CR=1 FL=1
MINIKKKNNVHISTRWIENPLLVVTMNCSCIITVNCFAFEVIPITSHLLGFVPLVSRCYVTWVSDSFDNIFCCFITIASRDCSFPLPAKREGFLEKEPLDVTFPTHIYFNFLYQEKDEVQHQMGSHRGCFLDWCRSRIQSITVKFRKIPSKSKYEAVYFPVGLEGLRQPCF